MEVAVRISLLAVILAYLACDHCIDCKLKMIPDRKLDMNRNSTNSKRQSDFDRAPICGRVLAVKTELRRELNESFDDDIQDGSDLDKIVGGGFAVPGEFPWMINLMFDYEHNCGAAIINAYWIITAAHCVSFTTKDHFAVVVGEFDLLKKDKYEFIYEIDMVLMHESYSEETFDYDVALLKVKPRVGGGIKFNNYVQPVCLAYATDEPQVGMVMTMTGWGYTQPFGYDADILKKTTVPVLEYDKCFSAYRSTMTHNMFCAGKFFGGTNVCKGDSGGPIVYQTSTGWVIFGTAAHTKGGCTGNFPGVYMNLSKFRNWIDTKIRSNSKGTEGLMPSRRPGPM